MPDRGTKSERAADDPDLHTVPDLSLHQGRRVLLRPVSSHDYDWLYALAVQGHSGYRWRYRGASPSPEFFARQMWDNILSQQVVYNERQGMLGLVGLYNSNPTAGHCYAFALSAPDVAGSGRVYEALLLLLDYGFRLWNFKKVYFEVPEFNLSQMTSAISRYFVEEGCLKDHEMLGGRSWDLHTFALRREVWDRESPRLLKAVTLASPDQ